MGPQLARAVGGPVARVGGESRGVRRGVPPEHEQSGRRWGVAAGSSAAWARGGGRDGGAGSVGGPNHRVEVDETISGSGGGGGLGRGRGGRRGSKFAPALFSAGFRGAEPGLAGGAAHSNRRAA